MHISPTIKRMKYNRTERENMELGCKVCLFFLLVGLDNLSRLLFDGFVHFKETLDFVTFLYVGKIVLKFLPVVLLKSIDILLRVIKD